MSILENELWEMDPGVSEILPALRLSYQRMPAHLKPCFRYCSMLPKNEKLNKNRLVRLWVAQGYIQAKTINNTVEETTKEYFDELLGRSFFQEDKYWRNSFEMHDLIFDLAVFISSNEFLKITMGGGKQNKLLSDNIRHLVIYHESTHNGMGQVPIVVWRSSSSLRNLLVENCHELSTLRGLCNLHFLERLKFNRCYNLLISAEERLPSKLQYVCFSDCRKLTSVTGLHDLHFLEKLELERCPKLQLSLDESFSIMASNVNVIDCPRLKEWCQKYGFEFKQFEQSIEPLRNSLGVDGGEVDENLLLSDDCKGLDISDEATYKVDDALIYGREDDKKKLIKLLLSDYSGGLDIPLIQIIGPGGIGKSTLAYLIYTDSMICDYFDLRAWVQLPESSDVGRILKAVIESLTGIYCYVTDLNELKHIIGEELSSKRFLIILDNLRNGKFSFWSSLMVSLSIGAKGSIVMVTTRTEIISDLTQSIRPYHLNSLSDKHCFSIFLQYAFDKQEPCIFPELIQTGKHIVAKCEGIPLAAKAVGSLLRFNENNLPAASQYWKDVLESTLWDSDEFLPALSLCYDYLPMRMKHCFSYCSLFPEGYIFEKDNLIKLWMSQGYLDSTDGEAAEDIGINCFEELLRRTFFQRLPINDVGEQMMGTSPIDFLVLCA